MALLLLTTLMVALTLPAAARADSQPAPAPTVPSQPAAPCDLSCTSQSQGSLGDPQQLGTGSVDPAAQSPPDPDENQTGAELFVVALLAALLVIVPMTIARQRDKREASSRPVLELDRGRRRRGRRPGGGRSST